MSQRDDLDAPSGAPGEAAPEGPSSWNFGPADGPVLVRNAEALMAHLAVFLGGWPVHWAGLDAPATPDIDIVERPGERFVIARRGPAAGESCHDDPLEAADALAVALVDALIGGDAGSVGLTAAGVRLGGGLTVLLGDRGSGRRLVALQLAARGYRLYGADRLALRLTGDDPPEGLCLGLMPRLRLPLPPVGDPRFTEFIDGYTELRIGDVAHLKLWDGEAANFGETAPLTAVIELARAAERPARLDDRTPAEIGQALLRCAFAPHIAEADLSALLEPVAAGVAGYRLEFSDCAEAAGLLAERLRRS